MLTTTSSNVRSILKELLESTSLKAYPDEAPQDAVYPYAVFEVKILSGENPKKCVLEVNIWDFYKNYSRVDSLMDNLEKALDLMEVTEGNLTLWIFKGDRKHILDEDKLIKRCRERFELKIKEGK